MKRIIKKGMVLTSIQCSNGFYSNNLYCQNIIIMLDDSKKILTISLDYSREFRKKSADTYDFNQFVESINSLEIISFYDKYATNKIREFFIHNFKMGYDNKVLLHIDKLYLLDAGFYINGTDHFEIKIKGTNSIIKEQI